MTDDIEDRALSQASDLVNRALQGSSPRALVQSFFDAATCTVSHIVSDPTTKACAIIDSVLDFDPSSGRTQTASAQKIIATVTAQSLNVLWLLETHAHADHLSAAPHLQDRLGGKVAIGSAIAQVQEVFGDIFNVGTAFARDGSQFDHLFQDGERFAIGALEAMALHVPGHTPACMAYVVGDCVFPGDTLFMPDYGTARCDFPGGSAAALFHSIRRLQQLPDAARVFLCHDYKAPGRDRYAWETNIAAQRHDNIHIHAGVGLEEFVRKREARDATLAMPQLLLPSVQVNLRAGRLPEPESNGVRYLKIPLDVL